MSNVPNANGTMNPYIVSPVEIIPEQGYGYKVIAVAWGSWNGWCAYRGLTDWDDNRVLESGDEISYEAAKALFPSFANSGRIYGGT